MCEKDNGSWFFPCWALPLPCGYKSTTTYANIGDNLRYFSTCTDEKAFQGRHTIFWMSHALLVLAAEYDILYFAVCNTFLVFAAEYNTKQQL